MLRQLRQAGRSAAATLPQEGASAAGLAHDLVPAGVVEEDAIARLADVVRCAEGLSAALQRFWALPEQVAAARLELAQAAATRSCAYLRCPNTDGVPEGERGSSKVCTGCRSVRYCDTACSHADWREGGHRQVCKALAAARQAAIARQ